MEKRASTGDSGMIPGQEAAERRRTRDGDSVALHRIAPKSCGSFVDILEDNARLAFGIVIRLGGS